MRRVAMSRSEPAAAPAIGSRATHCQPSWNGRTMSSTPENPTRTAVQRRHPTRSPSIEGAKAVMISGDAKVRAMTVESGISPTEVTKKAEAITNRPARTTWPLMLWTRRDFSPPPCQTKKNTGTMKKTPRRHRICPTG